MKVFYIPIVSPVSVRSVRDSENGCCEDLQMLVGGYLERERLFSNAGLTVLVNAEAWELGLPYNRHLAHLRGPAVFVGVDKRGRLCSLTDTQIGSLTRLFSKPTDAGVKEEEHGRQSV